jgi:hypothetical protein
VAPGATVDVGTVQLTAQKGTAPAGSTPPVHHEPFP